MGAERTSAEHATEVSRHCIAIAEHSPLPMATVEGDRHIVRYANPAFCRLMERPIGELVGKPFDELLPDKDQCATMLARVFRTGKPESHTETEHSKEHPVFWSYTIWPVLADKGLVGVMIQVIETTQVHEKTVAMNEALLLGSLRQHELTEAAENLNAQLRVEMAARKQGEEQLRLTGTAMEAAAYAIFITDREGVIQYVNPAFTTITGYVASEAIGRNPNLVKSNVHEDAFYRSLWQTVCAGEVWIGEITNRHKDGQHYVSEQTIAPVKDALGEITHFVSLQQDITVRKEADEALREAKEVAEAANRSKDRFLAVLSHELRTPLTPVLMAVAALEHDPELRRDVREEMTMIKRNVELEVKFIDDLLDVSRIASGKVPLKLEPLDLNGTVREVCADHRAQLLGQDVRLEMELAGDVGVLVADATRLRQVISNVFRNAVKFTPAQGTIRVTSARLSPDRCEVRVRDSGIGIPPEVLPHIFEAFEQGDARVTRQFGGLGLGLTIAKALAEQHGGSIRAESAGAGQGATFIIELPGEHPAVAAAAPPVVPEADAPARLRLLIVEDHADTARALSRLLGKAGFVVSVAGDVATALALAGQETFDLLISDLGLPDGTGYDVMAGVQKIRPLPGIAMSGYGMDEDVLKSREAGFSEHLVKPVEVPQLIAAIRRVMNQTP